MSEWLTIRLGSVVRTNTTSYSPKEGWKYVNYLDTGNITENVIDAIQHIDLENEKLPSRAKRKVQMNSILYSTVRPNQKHFGIIKSMPKNFLVSTGFVVIDVIPEKADADYLYFWLTQNIVVEQLHAIAEQSVSAYPSIKASDIENLEIALPPLTVQKSIASILKSISDKMSHNSSINENLEQQIRSLFRVRFTDNPALEKMKQVPLSDLCQIVTKGTTPTTLGKPFVKSGINFIKAESILDSHAVDKSKFAFIDEETNALLKRSVIKAGDIVFTIAGTLGRFALIDKNVLPANTNQAVAIIRADVEKVLPEYIYACFIGEWHNHYYSKRVQQAVQANLSLTTIKSLPIPLLDESEMVNFTKLIIPLIKMIKQNEIQNETLTSMRDTLLPKLVSGELDVSAVQL